MSEKKTWTVHEGTIEEFEVAAPSTHPTISPWWPLWRLYGHLIYRPWGMYWSRQLRSELWTYDDAYGSYVHRWLPNPVSEVLGDWCWRADRKTWLGRLKRWFGRITYGRYQGTWVIGCCPHCGFEHADFAGEDKYFECTDSGSYGTQDGTIHWWQGWQTCARCGHVEFESEST